MESGMRWMENCIVLGAFWQNVRCFVFRHRVIENGGNHFETL